VCSRTKPDAARFPGPLCGGAERTSEQTKRNAADERSPIRN
jgi:hypothetical protein